MIIETYTEKKTIEEILTLIPTNDLHFLKYQERNTKNNKSIIRGFSSVEVKNLSYNEIAEYLKNDNNVLIRIV